MTIYHFTKYTIYQNNLKMMPKLVAYKTCLKKWQIVALRCRIPLFFKLGFK